MEAADCEDRGEAGIECTRGRIIFDKGAWAQQLLEEEARRRAKEAEERRNRLREECERMTAEAEAAGAVIISIVGTLSVTAACAAVPNPIGRLACATAVGAAFAACANVDTP